MTHGPLLRAEDLEALRGMAAGDPALLHEPVSAISSLAYVAAAALCRPAPRTYPVLVAGIGVGSFVQHGPNPPAAHLLHDLPLVGTLAFVAADAAAQLAGRSRPAWWWALPTAALVPAIVAVPTLADTLQACLAAAAIALSLARVRVQPEAGRRTALAFALLAVGATVGTLSRPGWVLHDPAGLLEGHAIWHLLSAAALVVLAPVIGAGAAESLP